MMDWQTVTTTLSSPRAVSFLLPFAALGALVAAYSVAKSLVKAASGLFPAFKFNPKKGGNWAVITGASDGIGREIAIQLAQKGYSTVLIAR